MYTNLLHCFSTRTGGFSQGILSGLNLGLSTKDDKKNVHRNRNYYFNQLGISEDFLAIPKQVHSAEVQIVDNPGVFDNCDALITNKNEVYLTVQTADCFPVFLYDPVKKVCGLVHSGWKGTAHNITGNAVQMMKTRFKCKPENIVAAIGPGVQQWCYQVNHKTANYFSKKYLVPDGLNHYLLDIQTVIISQLKESGVLDENLEIDRRCTHCEETLFFSYRRDGAQSGRMMGVIGLKP